jgi:ribose transport system substrate-binding protein
LTLIHFSHLEGEEDMDKKGTKSILAIMSLIMVAALIASCSPAATPTAAPQPTTPPAVVQPTTAAATAPAAQPTAAPTAASAQPTAAAPSAAASTIPQNTTGKKFTIGVSNPFISSEYRTQMIQELKDVNTEYMNAGWTNDLVIESADTDLPGQIQQLQNLINKKVDAILVNPGDVNGLNATLTDAISKGIIVISVDQALSTKGVLDVGIDQTKWAETSADWLAKKLNGTGNIVEIEGIPGHPANIARMNGVANIFKNNPNIKVLGKQTGNWDEATGQQVMSQFLASFPTMTGYWTQDGMAIGALQAVMAANPATWPQGVGEGRCQFLSLWNDALKTHPDFDSIAVANPPGAAPTGLRIAVNMLMGKKVDTTKLGGVAGNQFVLPIPVTVTKDNFQQVYNDQCANGKHPASYLLDGIMTDQEVQQFFVK